MEKRGLVTRTFRRLDPERQQAIVNAILDEAAENGPASLRVKQVAERAEVSVGSLYTYFPNRQGLLDFAVELCVKATTGLFETVGPYLAELPLEEALIQYLSGGLEWSQAQAGLLQFFGRAAYQGNPDLAERVVRPIAASMRQVISGLLAQAAERGDLRAGVDLEAMTSVINALLLVVADSQLLPYLNVYFQVTGDGLSYERVQAALAMLIAQGVVKNAV
jgi:AcrR family transcriptional regulator